MRHLWERFIVWLLPPSVDIEYVVRAISSYGISVGLSLADIAHAASIAIREPNDLAALRRGKAEVRRLLAERLDTYKREASDVRA